MSVPPKESAAPSPPPGPARAGRLGAMRSWGAWVVVLASAAAYLNATPPALVYDDAAFVADILDQDRPAAAILGDIVRGRSWTGSRSGANIFRPVTFATVLLDRVVFGKRVAGYHAASVLYHVAVALLLYFLLRAMLERAARDGPARRACWVAAAAAAVVFGVHPVHTESVDSIFNRGDILVSLFSLGSLLLVWHLEPRRPWAAWAGGAGLFLAALLCKENAVTLALLAPLVMFLLRFDGGTRARLRRLLPAALMLAAVGVYALLRRAVFAGEPNMWTGEFVTPLGSPIALSVTGFREMLGIVAWPHPLRANRTDFIATGVPLAAAVVIAYAGAAAWAWRKSPGVAAGLLFFAAAVVPSTRIFTRFTNAQVIAERYLYFPSVGLALALAFGLAALGRTRLGPRAVAAAGAAAFAILAPLTLARNADWRSNIALAEADAAAAPDSTDVLIFLLRQYTGSNMNDEALALCEKHRAVPSGDKAAFYSFCAIHIEQTGKSATAEEFFKLGLGPHVPAMAYYSYARFLAHQRRFAESGKLYARAIEISIDPVRRKTIRAEMLLKLHPDRLDEALAEVNGALAQDPGFSLALQLRSNIVAAIRRRDAKK